jgi:hypothetical protein
MSKEYFSEIKDCHSQIRKQLKKNRKNVYVQEIKNSIGSHKDILEQFPVYFKKVLYPIAYERVFGKEDKSQGYGKTAAINKWFGNKGWKNIGMFNDRELINSLTQEHIDIIPDHDKKKIAQDFFNYSRIFTEESKENIVQVVMNVPTKLYDFNWVQIRDMNKSYNKTNNSYYSSGIEDDSYVNYIYPKATIDAVVDKGIVEYNATNNTIKILFYHLNQIVEEIFVSKKTIEPNKDDDDNDDEDSNTQLFLSEKLLNWHHFSQYFKGKFHEMYLDNIENLLTHEIKKTVNMFIARQKTIKDDWIKLQEKYAKNLLFKGNI